MRIARTDRSVLAEWWFTIDRVLLAAVLVIACAGVFLSLAARPAAAIKRGLPPFHFAERHALFAAAAVVLAIAVSMATPAQVRRLALLALVASLAAMVAVLLIGTEVNGARRWLRLGVHSVQPSELVKPAFAVLAAWLLAESERRPDVPAMPLAIALLLVTASLLALQPDIGQTILITLVWATLLFAAGKPVALVAGVGGLGAAALAGAYLALPYVRIRIDKHFGSMPGDTFQIDRAMQSFIDGGLLGKGPGEGTIKAILPDAHTDFVLAVIAEEYGVLACLALVGLYALVAIRAMARAVGEPDAFVRLGIVGLTVMFALQALINVCVNVGLLPAKGMTLPLVSSGGSSSVGIGLTLGMLLALTRRRIEAPRRQRGAGPAGYSALARDARVGR